MRIDVVAIMALLYCGVLVMKSQRLFKQYRKTALTSVMSGLLLFGYATALYISHHDVSRSTFIVILAVSMLQIAAFDVYRSDDKKKDIQRQVVLLIFHITMACLMIR